MPLKTYKPTTPARRYLSTVKTDALSKRKPKKALTRGGKRAVGRSGGSITTRHKGAGVKRRYRQIDKQMKPIGAPFSVASLEYDPNRTAWIALLTAEGHDDRYIVAIDGLKEGDKLTFSDEKIDPTKGSRMPIKFIPEGTDICALEMQPGRGAQTALSAGTFVTILSKEGDRVQIKMPSGEVRVFEGMCRATIGRISNIDHGNQVIGKAGRVRKMGKRPSVRG